MANTDQAQRFLDEHGITQTEIAGWLEVEPATVSRKLSGARKWTLIEAQRLAAIVSARLGRTVSVEEMFGAVATEPAPVEAGK